MTATPISQEEMSDNAPCSLANPKYDLTKTLAPYMDLHFMFPLVDFLSMNQMYEENTLMAAKLELLKPTNMADFAKEVYQSLHGTEDFPVEFDERREAILDELSELKRDCGPMLDLVDNEEEVLRLQDEKLFTVAHLDDAYQISQDTIDSFYKYAKFQYECGNYQDSLRYLSYYLVLMPNSSPNYLNALWGKLASEILMFKWDDALQDLSKLMDAFENQAFTSPLEQLQQRTWLIHWSLFIFAWHKEGRDAVIDFMFQQRCIEAIQTNAPWILRYLSVGVIVHKRRKALLRELMNVLKQEESCYSDPVTKFVQCLCMEFDFSSAQEQLLECDVVLQSDFFLYEDNRVDFMENARLFMFEMYCRIHKKIDIKMLASKLNMEGTDAERWIVDCIRIAHLDAKIDSQNGFIIMGMQSPSIYQQAVDKTKELTVRTYNLASSIERFNIKDQRWSSR